MPKAECVPSNGAEGCTGAEGLVDAEALRIIFVDPVGTDFESLTLSFSVLQNSVSACSPAL